MIYIDKYAYISALKNIKPELKIIFSILGLVSCILSKSIFAHLFIFLICFIGIVFKAKILFLYYIKLLILPFSFLIFSLIGIIINISKISLIEENILNFSLFNLYFYVTKDGLVFALKLISKSISAVSCLYFLILTTPMPEIISFLNQLKCPKILLTLISLVYRFIFIVMDIATIKLKSQQCRFGYTKLKGFTKTFSMLWASVFVQSFLKSEWIYKSMLVRGYDEEMKFLDKKIVLTLKDILMLISFSFLILVLNFL